MIVTYRVFREDNGQYTVHEVFLESDGSIVTYGRTPVCPRAGSPDELTREVEAFKQALALPALTAAEVEALVASQSPVVQTAVATVATFIERDPEKLSGVPVFAGTRVPVQTLFDCLEEGENLDDFLDQFPTVTRQQAVLVLEASSARLLTTYEAVV
jgi:uncharacterized protein (DUF433 family)